MSDRYPRAKNLRRCFARVLSLLASGCLAPCPATGGEPEAAPVSVALQAARVLTGEGYERRAIVTELSLQAGKSIDLPVYLFHQNTYCFLLTSENDSDELTFAVIDDEGTVVDRGSYLQVKKPLHIFYLQPETSGRHHLRLVNLGDASARLILTYCYR